MRIPIKYLCSILIPVACSLFSCDFGVHCPPFETVPESPYGGPIWHPGGQFIGFNHIPLQRIEYPHGVGCQGVQYFDGASAGFWLINADGTNKRRIFPYKLQTPAWSPGGEWIAFVLGAQIFKMRFTGATFDTTTLTQLTFEGRNFLPAWSPDGEWIAYQRSLSDETGPAGIWRMKADGSSKQSLFSGAFPTWHPSGNEIIGVIGTSPTSIWKQFVRYDLSESRFVDSLAAAVDKDNRHPRYSPNGTRIAFTSSPSPTGANIWLMNNDGTNLQQITNEGVDVTFGLPFSWSPDGSRIVYTRYRSDEWTMSNGVLWILNLQTGEKKQITFNP